MDIAMSMLRSIFLVTVLTCGATLAQYYETGHLPTAQYNHEIIYPTQDQFAGSPDFLSSGFRLKSSDENSFLQRANGFQGAGNLFHRPAITAADLFTPNTVQQPAETTGQMENYMKALEEARDADKAENDITTLPSFYEGYGEYRGFARERPSAHRSYVPSAPRSYVDVKVDSGKGYNYGYTV